MPHPAEQDRALTEIPPPDLDAMPRLVARAVAIALLDLQAGVREEPAGSNRGPKVDLYLAGVEGNRALLCAKRYAADPADPCPFCADQPTPTSRCRGCAWCARAARHWINSGALLEGVLSPLPGGRGLASAAKWRRWAEEVGRWRAAKEHPPRPGWVGLLGTTQRSGHVTILTSVLDPPERPARLIRVPSIEGNSGDRVRVVERMWSAYDGGVDLS